MPAPGVGIAPIPTAMANKIQLVVDKVAKSYGVHEIFKQISFTLRQGEKVGLVGVNGSGKSTLLRCLLALEKADEGSIKFAPELRLGYVEQGFGRLGAGTLWEYLAGACQDIIALRAKLKQLEKKAASVQPGPEQEEVLREYANAEARYEHLDGYNYEVNIKKVLLGLGFPERDWTQTVANFSGGQKTRIMLAGALVNAPELLILDEPTNHLDITMMEWLEKYLQEFKGGLLVVSHDRSFLDNVADSILEMEGGGLQRFKGNYSRYLEQKAVQVVTRERAYEAQQEYIRRQEDYIRRFKAGIKSKMARGRQSQLDRLERLDAPVENEEFTLQLPTAAESAEKVIMLEDLSVGYAGKALVSNINLELRRGEKVAVLGANGTGKTTLLKTILQEIPPLRGSAKVGNRVQIGYFSQSYERLNPKQTILDNFLTEYGYTDEQTRKLLGSMLFHGEDVFKEIGTLSGGQKARLVLLKLVLDGANCLLLDEPTNHLDILAKEAVEAALATFNGTVLLVSHDRYLVNEVAERIWSIEAGRLVDYKGNFDFYLQTRATTAAKDAPLLPAGETKTEEEKEKTAAAGQPPVSKRYNNGEAAKLLPKVELSIREQEALLKIQEQKMADPANHATLEDSQRLATEYETIKATVDKLMEQWEQLMESLEQ